MPCSTSGRQAADLQYTADGIPANDWNMQFRSAAYTSCLFRVGKNGALHLTNISGATPYQGMAYGQPMIISEAICKSMAGITAI